MDYPFRFTKTERQAVYRVIRERRDIREFESTPVSNDVLLKILDAAKHAPSVGYMQPWNFIVIRSNTIRQRIFEAFHKANTEALEMFTEERKKQYRNLKLEGILTSGVNICVTCDRNRFGPVVLGRTCQPDMDLYSVVCAVQNLWLAARVEGIGVGWVSIIHPEDLVAILELPSGVVPVAYLCVGYTSAFHSEPELKRKGWLPEVPLSEVVYFEKWGNRE